MNDQSIDSTNMNKDEITQLLMNDLNTLAGLVQAGQLRSLVWQGFDEEGNIKSGGYVNCGYKELATAQLMVQSNAISGLEHHRQSVVAQQSGLVN